MQPHSAGTVRVDWKNRFRHAAAARAKWRRRISGVLAQLEARVLSKDEVLGSKPRCSKFILSTFIYFIVVYFSDPARKICQKKFVQLGSQLFAIDLVWIVYLFRLLSKFAGFFYFHFTFILLSFYFYFTFILLSFYFYFTFILYFHFFFSIAEEESRQPPPPG